MMRGILVVAGVLGGCMAAAGARFANSFVTNSICTPSRATLLTGQYSHVNGVPVFNPFDGARDHVAKRLRAAGYHTGIVQGVDDSVGRMLDFGAG
jgi:arylsulfatase A-like enzyme